MKQTILSRDIILENKYIFAHQNVLTVSPSVLVDG